MPEQESGFIPEEEQENKPNLLMDFNKAVNAIIEIESVLSKNIQAQDKSILKDSMYSAKEYIKHLQSSDPDSSSNISVTGFQGLGGWNRYSVKRDGTIGLSRTHTTQECADKAEELGIEVFEYGF